MNPPEKKKVYVLGLQYDGDPAIIVQVCERLDDAQTYPEGSKVEDWFFAPEQWGPGTPGFWTSGDYFIQEAEWLDALPF